MEGESPKPTFNTAALFCNPFLFPHTIFPPRQEAEQLQPLNLVDRWKPPSPHQGTTPDSKNMSQVVHNDPSSFGFAQQPRTSPPIEKIRRPRTNANNNNNNTKPNKKSLTPKNYTCKNCFLVTTTTDKNEHYRHIRTHMDPSKIIQCTFRKDCEFVTELKHHYEFHMRNHTGEKPFSCKLCDYQCTNKSMLTSHMKSHSQIHQFHCADCPYVSKYQHSMKLHLRKNKHLPGVILNPDGTPNPNSFIDVNGTKRGPKARPSTNTNVRNVIPRANPSSPASAPMEQQPKITQEQLLSLTMFQFMFANPHLPLPLLCQMAANQIAASPFGPLAMMNPGTPGRYIPQQHDNSVAGSSPSSVASSSSSPGVHDAENLMVKLEINDESDQDEEDMDTTTMFGNVETSLAIDQEPADHNICPFCKIDYRHKVLFDLHMRYHSSPTDPFTCICGIKCEDYVGFASHLMRNSH